MLFSCFGCTLGCCNIFKVAAEYFLWTSKDAPLQGAHFAVFETENVNRVGLSPGQVGAVAPFRLSALEQIILPDALLRPWLIITGMSGLTHISHQGDGKATPRNGVGWPWGPQGSSQVTFAALRTKLLLQSCNPHIADAGWRTTRSSDLRIAVCSTVYVSLSWSGLILTAVELTAQRGGGVSTGRRRNLLTTTIESTCIPCTCCILYTTGACWQMQQCTAG